MGCLDKLYPEAVKRRGGQKTLTPAERRVAKQLAFESRDVFDGVPSEMELYASNCMTRKEQKHQDGMRKVRTKRKAR